MGKSQFFAKIPLSNRGSNSSCNYRGLLQHQRHVFVYTSLKTDYYSSFMILERFIYQALQIGLNFFQARNFFAVKLMLQNFQVMHKIQYHKFNLVRCTSRDLFRPNPEYQEPPLSGTEQQVGRLKGRQGGRYPVIILILHGYSSALNVRPHAYQHLEIGYPKMIKLGCKKEAK